jgi:hypothetical protein
MMRKPLLSDEFFNSLESSAREVEAAEMLPPACYVDRDFWEFEKEAIFGHEWLCVGREAWARNPGDYFTSAHMGEPIVVVRNREGVLKAMSTVCQHRAMLVVEGRGNAKAFPLSLPPLVVLTGRRPHGADEGTGALRHCQLR